MAIEVEYRKIPGRDEMFPVFGNLSRSVVKRGADKIYWRLKDVREKRFGGWDDGVWLDCETGDVGFGERFIRGSWSDYYDDAYSASRYKNQLSRYEDPFSRDFSTSSYRRKKRAMNSRDYLWYLGSLSEWRGPDDEIEPRLAARLAEAAEFNFGLDFTGAAEAPPFLAAANEVARFYETRARFRREEDEANGKSAAEDGENGDGKEDETSFRYCESEAFGEWEAQEKRNQESDDAKEYDYWENGDFGAFDKKKGGAKNTSEKNEEKSDAEEFVAWDREYHYKREVPVCRNLEQNGRYGEPETSAKIIFGATPLALVPRYWEREREIEEAEPEPKPPRVSAKDVPKAWSEYWKLCNERRERIRAQEKDLRNGFDFSEYRADESPRLGEVDELIAEARSGTSSEGEEPDGEFAPATRSDALSDDWRERLPSLLDYRLDRCNALFQAAKTLYVEILGTKVRSMKALDVWVARSGGDLETYVLGDRPKNPTWLKIGALTEFYEAKRGVYWGAGVKKESKISRKDDARHWLTQEIGRRLEAALKAQEE